MENFLLLGIGLLRANHVRTYKQMVDVVDIFLFPTKLIEDILSSWVGCWKSLAQLDIACCNRALRPQLSTVRIVVTKLFVLSPSTIGWIAWVNNRSIFPRRLTLSPQLAAKVISLLGGEMMESVHAIRLVQPSILHAHITAHDIKNLLAHFPRATSLDISRWPGIEDSHIDAITKSKLHLQALNIKGCHKISIKHLCSLIASIRQHLRSLYFTAKTVIPLQFISTVCRLAIVHIEIDPDCSLTSKALRNFCTSYIDSLEELHIHDHNHETNRVVDEFLIEELAEHCPTLRRMEIQADGNLFGCQCLPTILSNCSSIEKVVMPSYSLVAHRMSSLPNAPPTFSISLTGNDIPVEVIQEMTSNLAIVQK